MASIRPLLDALAEPGAARPRIELLDQAGTLTAMVPELEEGRAFQQPELHAYDVLTHNLAALGALDTVLLDGEASVELRNALAWIDLDNSLDREVGGLPLIALIRLGCLLHDVAKPATATYLEGRLRFPRHGPRGAEMMQERLTASALPAPAVDLVARLIRYHLRPVELIRNWPVTDRAVRRFTAALDGHVLPLLLVNLCDGMATRGPSYTRENFRRHCGFINYVVGRAWAAHEAPPAPLVTGDELITELDLSSGRLLGTVLTSIRNAQYAGTISTRDEALALARSIVAARKEDQAPQNG